MKEKYASVNDAQSSAKIMTFIQKLREKEECRNREKSKKWNFDFKLNQPSLPMQENSEEKAELEATLPVDWKEISSN